MNSMHISHADRFQSHCGVSQKGTRDKDTISPLRVKLGKQDLAKIEICLEVVLLAFSLSDRHTTLSSATSRLKLRTIPQIHILECIPRCFLDLTMHVSPYISHVPLILILLKIFGLCNKQSLDSHNMLDFQTIAMYEPLPGRCKHHADPDLA